MKKRNFFVNGLIVLTLSAGVFGITGCSKTSDSQLSAVAPLSSSDSLALVHMREEEKLARDVYQGLYNLYGTKIFTNIASSEQVHMDRVLTVLNTYGITDPASSQVGVFVNPDIAQLYDKLMAQGKKSFLEALKVGAEIEDLDIYDLQNFLLTTKNQEIKTLFSFLECGSENHMRAFSKQLTQNGVNYVPQYISEIKYQEIISSTSAGCQ